MLKFVLSALFFCSLVFPVFAFNPPIDEKDGLELRIEGVPEKSSVRDAFTVRAVLENKSEVDAAGTLYFLMNEDWKLDFPSSRQVEVKAGKHLVFELGTAPLAKRILPAHYAVHAYFKGRLGAQGILLHPIAIFQTTKEAAPAENAGLAPAEAGIYTCVRAPEALTLEKLVFSQWEGAQIVALGQEQAGTGTLDSGSFQAEFRAMHTATQLVLAVRVVDDDISCMDLKSNDFMNSDYVRFYLAPVDPRKRKDDQLSAVDAVVATNVFGGENKSPLSRIPNYAQKEEPRFKLADCRFFTNRTEEGYTFVAVIPFSSLGDGVATGSVLGFNLMVGDADRGRRVGEALLGRKIHNYWLNPESYIRLQLSPSSSFVPGELIPPLVVVERKNCNLASLISGVNAYGTGEKAVCFAGSLDEKTAAVFAKTARPVTLDGKLHKSFSVHPPYREGAAGQAVWRSYRFSLPEIEPIALRFANAIRKNSATEPASDGIEFKVMVKTAEADEECLFTRFTDSKTWVPGEADLSKFAGREITLKLWAGPGPKKNTTCDLGYWGNPFITVGKPAVEESPEVWRQRADSARGLAEAAAEGKARPGAFALGEGIGAAVVPGPLGLADAAIAFTAGGKTVVHDGFVIEVGGQQLGAESADIQLISSWMEAKSKKTTIHHVLKTSVGMVEARAEFRVVGGALQVEFEMPKTRRDKRGEPRFTRLGIGAADSGLFRIYLGFGNVIEKPEAFSLRPGGFTLSTRHVGADYANGLSLLQACRIYPDQAVCDPKTKTFRLEASHDNRFFFIPSAKGAFAAARAYRDIAGFKPAKGYENLVGRMCLDQWGGDYILAAENIARAAKYGLNHAVFVKHCWQRWGYDYRLPDIYPPMGKLEDFQTMRNACKEAGILFCPHDNYIDFYPDADGYSYDHIIFNADGSPQRAWFNKGRKAQSYRWLPHAFRPWLVRNMNLLKRGAQPDALFIDVFTAMAPKNYYDRSGKYYTKERCTKEWADAFDRSRRILGGRAPMICEAGHDALIGSLDGGQSDHYSADRWGARGVAATRTPWHDMASHGTFLLFAGGLGHRYGNKDQAHTYGTDDYLCNTVIGGRNPMCDGPFSRRAVMTYWLQHDLCDDLARADLETHAFGESVYQQHTTFSDGSQVYTNRAEPNWKAMGYELPEYGFIAKSPQNEAGIVAIDGQTVSFARNKDTYFVDARPPYRSVSNPKVFVKVTGGEYLGDGKFRVRAQWKSTYSPGAGYTPFVHICGKHGKGSEDIFGHGSTTMKKDDLLNPTTLECDYIAQFSGDAPSGVYKMRFGLYNPKKGGGRLVPGGPVEGSRVRGGKMEIVTEKGKVVSGKYIQEYWGDEQKGLNVKKRLVDFGSVVTNGAFRLQHGETNSWLLTPLPGSVSFVARIRLADFGQAGKRLARVEVVGGENGAEAPEVSCEDGVLKFAADGRSFAYRLEFE